MQPCKKRRLVRKIMHFQLPGILRCIVCGTEGLRIAQVDRKDTGQGSERLVSGKIECPQCSVKYSVEDGILNFLPVQTPNIGLGQLTNHNRLVAWGYERFWRPEALTKLGGREWPPEEELATIIKMLNTAQPEKITTHNSITFFLDLGCSTGFYARAIAKALKTDLLTTGAGAGHVVALDNSWQMLQEARHFIEEENLAGRISLVRADAEKLPFIADAFAGIACGGSLNEFQHTFAALNEMRRTLARHGKAALMVQMRAGRKIGTFIQEAIHATSGLHFFKPERLNELYQEARFKLVEQQASGLITISKLTTND